MWKLPVCLGIYRDPSKTNLDISVSKESKTCKSLTLPPCMFKCGSSGNESVL